VPKWYISRADQTLGPYLDEEIEGLSLNNNQLQPDDQVWNPYMNCWEAPPATISYLQQRKRRSYDSASLHGPPNVIASEGSSPQNNKPGKKFLFGALVLLVLFIITSSLAGIETALKLIGWFFTGLFILSLITTTKTFRQWKEVKPRTLFITALTAPVGLILFVVLSSLGTTGTFYLLLLGGMVAGVIWGFTTKVNLEGESVYSQGTIWGFIIWGTLIASLQISNLLFNISPEPLILLTTIQTGVMAIYNLTLAIRTKAVLKTWNTGDALR